MEYASYLAGERWSDHPRCTHPLLAGLARGVNDHISDAGRHRLVDLIPSVIGLTGDDPTIDIGIALRCASVALPVVAERRQRALAVGLLGAERILAGGDTGVQSVVDRNELVELARRALRTAPHAARWAEDFIDGARPASNHFHRRSAATMVRVAVTGIAEACIRDPDDLLYELLVTVIGDCSRWLGPTSAMGSGISTSSFSPATA